MNALKSYRLRLRRKRYLVRAWRKGRELTSVVNRTKHIQPKDILLFSTQRNEMERLPYFLDHYRKMGVAHFIIVDNGSTDGTAEFLAEEPDVSLWATEASYKKARYGVDWLTHLQNKYAHNHWTLVVDPDELFIYPFCDTRPLNALTDWLDAYSVKSFGAMLLDMYPKGPVDAVKYKAGDNPLDIANWFDAGNYTISKNHEYHNLWIQGGPRARVFFPENPKSAPALNKIPLVKWDKKYVYNSSTHNLLPRGLNIVYDDKGGERASGILLHTKFLSTFEAKTKDEFNRGQHYASGREYGAYTMSDCPELWCKWSEKYINWRQLEVLGLMSKGGWT